MLDQPQHTVKINRWFGLFVVQGSSIVQALLLPASVSRSLIPERGLSADSVGSLSLLGAESGAGAADFLFLPINLDHLRRS